MKKNKKHVGLDEFGTAIGLSVMDKEIIRLKNKMIDHLKEVRLKKAVSQDQLAKKLGTKQPAIARMEAGYVGEVSFDFLIRVAIALKTPLEIVPLKKAA
jgi:DNA-binding XRE family transcriptional regulator